MLSQWAGHTGCFLSVLFLHGGILPQCNWKDKSVSCVMLPHHSNVLTKENDNTPSWPSWLTVMLASRQESVESALCVCVSGCLCVKTPVIHSFSSRFHPLHSHCSRFSSSCLFWWLRGEDREEKITLASGSLTTLLLLHIMKGFQFANGGAN